ncbi:MAG: hypothetical protein KDK36_20245 [Leptospiraceae bacterium]|nr:hypothetical protein [Leptospiraceae bacterium]
MKKNNFLSKLIPLSLGIILLFHQSLFSNPNELNIGFGSCLDQDMSFEIFEKVIDQNPNYFIFMGDNIYLDSENPEEKIPAYKKFTENKKFLKLKKNTKLFFTWDDHDFGVNDAGNDYKEIEKSKEIFLKYIEEPNDSPRRKRKGVYDSYMVNFASKKIQIILLDTRTFRSPIKSRFWGFGSYIPNTDPGASFF